LERLTRKLEEMRSALQGRVYDVIGEMLASNGLDFERLVKETLANPKRNLIGAGTTRPDRRLVKETLANPKRRQASLERIDALSAEELRRYEEAVGIAQATRSVDLSWVRRHDWESEERRLMPEYVESFFRDAAEQVRLRVEPRAGGRYRVAHVPAAPPRPWSVPTRRSRCSDHGARRSSPRGSRSRYGSGRWSCRPRAAAAAARGAVGGDSGAGRRGRRDPPPPSSVPRRCSSGGGNGSRARRAAEVAASQPTS
ncbi:MAG TPA: hypothetical protein VE990_20025, partial [Acidimicrobiales bacterium]|nr:hypothetical protein [Acidimicrobiales bacterium]